MNADHIPDANKMVPHQAARTRIDEGEKMTDTFVHYTHICNVPIHYDRLPPPYDYGSQGKGPRTVHSTPAFRDQLTVWMEHLAEVCPWGKPEILVTAGFQVDKGGPRNAHRRGIAFDLDGLWWSHGMHILAKTSAAHELQTYLAVEAGLRQFFGWVRGRWADPPHDDHWHCDMSMAVALRPYSPRFVRFVQAALTYVLGRPVAQDGKWGAQTEGSVTAVIGGHFADSRWIEFLRLVEVRGWE